MADPTAPDAQPKSALWLAFRVFDEPTRVFQELAVRPHYWVPLACLVLVAAFAAFATPEDVLIEQTRDQIQAAVDRGQLTQEVADERIQNSGSMQNRVIILVAGTVVGAIMLLIVAGVLSLIFNAMSAEPVGFKREFAVVVHANMAALAGAVLAVLLAMFTGMRQPLSLGFLFGEDSGFLYQFANQITLFGAWDVYLLALGNMVLIRAKKIGTALMIIVGLWLLAKIPLALLGGMFGG